MLEQLIDFDINIFLFLNSFHSAFFDKVMYWISDELIWIPFYLTVLLFVFKKLKWHGIVVLGFLLLVLLLCDQSSVWGFKKVFHRLRPCHNPSIYNLVHIVNDHCGGKYGFVSSHAANCFGFAVFVLNFFRVRWFTITVLLWATIVGYSRIYLGVHYPGDILGGAILGSCIGFFIYKLYVFIDANYLKSYSPSTESLKPTEW